MRKIRSGRESASSGEFEAVGRYIGWRNIPVIAEGSPIGRLIILHDMTEERALEQLRDDFTHMIVHDLRNPINAILVNSTVASGCAPDMKPAFFGQQGQKSPKNASQGHYSPRW